jgi:hypothetical protein
MAVANTLAYHDTAAITDIKSVMTQGPGVFVLYLSLVIEQTLA